MHSKKVKAGVIALTAAVFLTLADTALAVETPLPPISTLGHIKIGSSSAYPNPNSTINAYRSKVDEIITNQINQLQSYITKISDATNIPDNTKTTYITQLQNQITTLTNIKDKIDSDTTFDAFRNDALSLNNLTNGNSLASGGNKRTLLVDLRPKAALLVTINTLNKSANIMASASAKLQVYVNNFRDEGKDVSSLQSSLDDMNSKIADAKQQAANAQTALNSITTTSTDVKTTYQSILNMLKIGRSDLQAARKDGYSVIFGLRGTKTPTPSTSPTTNP